jgi:hypothetical protein
MHIALFLGNKFLQTIAFRHRVNHHLKPLRIERLGIGANDFLSCLVMDGELGEHFTGSH